MNNTNSKSPMAKAFATVRGAIKRGNKTELQCKKVWLESVIRNLPDTIFANEAEAGLRIVNEMLN